MASIRIKEAERGGTTEKIEKILQGAMQEFLAHGYAGTSMDRVAGQAGVSKATVYSHFRDKEGLFKALIEQLARKKFQDVFGSEPLQGEPAIVLRKLITKALERMTDDEHCAFMRVLIGESGRCPELGKAWVNYIMKPTIITLGTYLDACPELNIPDSEVTVRIIIGSLVQFMMTQEMMYGKDIIPIERSRMVDGLMHHILGGGSNDKA